MKKSIIYTLILCSAAGMLFSSCKKSDFDNNYYDPQKVVQGNIGGLYAGLFDNPRVMPRYWNLYTFLIPVLGEYSQTIGYTTGSKIYEQPVNYTQDRWNDYYTGTMARYREVEKLYNALPAGAEKTGYQLFLETARIYLYDQTAQMVDMWGDIPFTTAGQLNATGKIVAPTYDKGKDIYDFILTDLKRISDYLTSVNPDPFYLNQLKKYDFLNSGNITEWRKYANSLRLRLAMRISYEDEAKAKSIIQEVLGNTQYPVIDNNTEDVQIKMTGNLISQNHDIREGFGVNPFAPSYMVDTVMVPSNDPRLPVFFSANKNGEYHGVPNTWNSSRVTDSVTSNYFSRYDSTTFTENNKFPGIVFTAAEVSFIKAEAFERWGGGDAKTAYETGIRQSIEFYYYVNSISDYNNYKTPPTETQITNYLNDPMIAYGSGQQQNLQKIATQKWIDFNVMQAQQAWAEWRRTKLPPFVFPTDPSSALSPNVPNRLLYPSTERILNAANYEAVKGEDLVTTKVFWDVK